MVQNVSRRTGKARSTQHAINWNVIFVSTDLKQQKKSIPDIAQWLLTSLAENNSYVCMTISANKT